MKVFEQAIGYMIQGLFTGLGIIMGNWIFEKYLKPTLNHGHNKLAKIPIPVKFPSKAEVLQMRPDRMRAFYNSRHTEELNGNSKH